VTNLVNLAELAADVEWPDHDAAIRAHDSLLNGPALGELGTLAEWTCGVQGQYPPREFTRARLVVFAADHAVAAAGVSRADPGATAAAVAAIESGAAGVSVLSRLVGAGVRVVQLDPSAGRIDLEDAMTATQCAEAMVHGGAVADEEIDAGADLLIVGNIGIASTTAAGALISVLTSAEPIKVTGRGGSGIDDDSWMQGERHPRCAAARLACSQRAPATAGGHRRPGSRRDCRFPAAGREPAHAGHP
jgi:nicotinate-nucleotide--dimethylbenzimidazole phosphoribosyltransferase